MAKQAKQANAPKVKTNAMRALDVRRILYAVVAYPDTIHSAVEVAQVLGVPAAQVFKTLVVLAEPGERHLLVVLPADHMLDGRLLAREIGAKAAQMALQRDAERLTGLKVGGISPLALLDKRFEVYLDAAGLALDELYISGGQRGVELRLRVADVLAITGAHVIRATTREEQEPPTA
jgi:Cys-tRNA(Pro)/Cys-tRNA(Cys) deacylase